MHLSYFVLNTLSLVLLLAALSQGHPASVSDIEERKTKKVPCTQISEISVEYFLGHMCKKTPIRATGLFYTSGLSKTAQAFSKADGHGLTTIWDMFPGGFYNRKIIKSNRLRCIMQDKAKRLTYFELMSQAFATVCDIHATVMDPNPSSPRLGGIWARKELPRLQAAGNAQSFPGQGGKVNVIEGVSPQGTVVTTFWKRDATAKRDFSFQNVTHTGHTNIATVEEEDDEDGCDVHQAFKLDVAEAFDNVGPFAVQW